MHQCIWTRTKMWQESCAEALVLKQQAKSSETSCWASTQASLHNLLILTSLLSTNKMLFCVFPDSFLIRTCLGILPLNPSPHIWSHTHKQQNVYFFIFLISLAICLIKLHRSLRHFLTPKIWFFLHSCWFVYSSFLLLFLKMWENFSLAPMEMLCVWSFCSVLYVFDIFGTSRWLDCMAWLLYGLHFGLIIYRRCGRDHSHVPK